MIPASLDFDTAVVGAGVVGVAAGAALAATGRSVVVLETRDGIAQIGSSRNSEVIHAGIYYPKQSLKATLCRRGSDLLYARCEVRRVGHKRIGKLIVATCDEEIPKLEALLSAARENDVPDISMIDAAEIARLEPDVAGVAALHSRATGIVDAHGLCLSYLAEMEEHGGTLLVDHKVTVLNREPDHWRVVVRTRAGEGDEQTLRCHEVVNAAGLEADQVAKLAGVDIDAAGYRIYLCKGDYFALAPGADVKLKQLVYPVGSASGAGLGVHATLDLAGRVRFGPDAHSVSDIDYQVDGTKASAFADAVARYLPAMRAEWLTPDFAGIRSKLAAEGSGFRDFVVGEESDKGLPGLVSCVGIESPGLTASGAIAERVVDLLDAR
jgi:L-2-hydroxyglutarate oxidase LhgO